MPDIDLMDLASQLAEIASIIPNGQVAARLLRIVEDLLTEAGLPPGEGGSETPSGLLSEPAP